MIWTVVLVAVGSPVAIAAQSPLLEWRDAVYIIGGFAGIVALSLMLLQPLLVIGDVPLLSGRRGRRAHVFLGLAITGLIGVHVVGLWVTSPPDIVDALLFRSPTPFSAWGVIAMWAIFASVVLAGLRFRLRPRSFRLAHSGLVVVIVAGSVLHAVQIHGTMGTISKGALCGLIGLAVARALAGRKVWKLVFRVGSAR
ncbi:ferric reductase-like transmembrane domain-containing protein [Marivita sp.]|uniref:ferric reductase-like transmembrane domain-containing protein n=1 Tax=Marivita sp. TaxID=2003365 RepID=UPI0025C3531B|nr:ferric reductase-like transmembrane domain-containing protein [Marivita sp.]